LKRDHTDFALFSPVRVPQLISCGPIEARIANCTASAYRNVPQLISCGPIEAAMTYIAIGNRMAVPQLISCGPIEAGANLADLSVSHARSAADQLRPH